MSDLINDPHHWRMRAEEARTRAAQLTDPLSRETMLGIAESYDRLAESAEARSLGRGTLR
jgi:hypothetical protein